MEQELTSKQYDDLKKQQIENDPNALYADSMREEKVANVIAQLDPQNLLE